MIMRACTYLQACRYVQAHIYTFTKNTALCSTYILKKYVHLEVYNFDSLQILSAFLSAISIIPD